MRKTILTTVAALSVLCTFAQWKPAGDKLKTPWAEKIRPTYSPRIRVRSWSVRNG